MLSSTAVSTIMKTFDWCDLPQEVAKATLPIPEIPAARWSLLNKVIMSASGTNDARGALQWKKAHRFVIKGAKPIFIVCPQTGEETDKDGRPITVTYGFVSVPVYGIESTYGDPIDYEPSPQTVLMIDSLWSKWNVDFRSMPARVGLNSLIEDSELELAQEEEKMFAWGLVRNVYYELHPDHQQRPDKQIVLHICARAFLYWLGKKIDGTENFYEEIRTFGEKKRLSSVAACFRICKLVEDVMNQILKVGLGQGQEVRPQN